MVSLEEGFLSPELFSKPINKHIYINKKKSSHPEFTKLLHPLDLVSERAEFVQQMGDISNNCGRKNNYTNMNYLSRRLRFKVYKLNAQFFNYRRTYKKCNSAPYRFNYSRGLPNIHKILQNETSKIKPVF